jgi:hypothetical protein
MLFSASKYALVSLLLWQETQALPLFDRAANFWGQKRLEHKIKVRSPVPGEHDPVISLYGLYRAHNHTDDAAGTSIPTSSSGHAFQAEDTPVASAVLAASHTNFPGATKQPREAAGHVPRHVPSDARDADGQRDGKWEQTGEPAVHDLYAVFDGGRHGDEHESDLAARALQQPLSYHRGSLDINNPHISALTLEHPNLFPKLRAHHKIKGGKNQKHRIKPIPRPNSKSQSKGVMISVSKWENKTQTQKTVGITIPITFLASQKTCPQLANLTSSLTHNLTNALLSRYPQGLISPHPGTHSPPFPVQETTSTLLNGTEYRVTLDLKASAEVKKDKFKKLLALLVNVKTSLGAQVNGGFGTVRVQGIVDGVKIGATWTYYEFGGGKPRVCSA